MLHFSHLQTPDCGAPGDDVHSPGMQKEIKDTAILALIGRFDYGFENVLKASIKKKGKWQAHKLWATFKLCLYKLTQSG